MSIILLLLLLLCVISIWCSYHVLSLTTFTLSSEKVNTPMRAVLISDQHDHIFRDDNEELIERILELEPDVVFMDGDMLNADSDDISWLLSEIERLSAKVPVYYALGNHELAYMAAHPDLITQLEEAGAIVLDEQYVDVEIAGNAVRIGGFYDYAFSQTDAKTTADTMDAQDHAVASAGQLCLFRCLCNLADRLCLMRTQSWRTSAAAFSWRCIWGRPGLFSTL